MTNRHAEYFRAGTDSRCAVLMIHGIVGTPRHFDFLLPGVPENWSIYNIRLDGHGAGVREFSRTSTEKWKQQVKSRLEELSEKHDVIVVFGHSLGTLLTLDALPQFPKIRGLLLLNPPLHVHFWPRTWLRMLRVALGCIDESDPLHRATRDACGLTQDWRLWRYVGWLPRYVELLQLCRESRGRIGRIRVPCRVIHSRHDELVNSRRTQPYFAGNPFIQAQMLEESWHFYYPGEDAEAICRTAKALLQEAEKGESL